MASTDRDAAMGPKVEDAAEEDLMASASSLWLPRTVVKRHRKKATLIWVFLLVAFVVYVGYVVWDTVDARRNPAASVQHKQSYFTFPDVAVCTSFLNGCLSSPPDSCLFGEDLILSSQTGFMEDIDTFDLADYPGVAKVESAFPNCAVMPLSKLTVNKTGVDNGDIGYLSASFWMIWFEDLYDTYNSSELGINTQHVSVQFIDIEQDVEEIGEKSTDVMLPYERIDIVPDEWFTASRNHMVISLSEFSGITKNGVRKEREQTYSQTTTTAKDNWFWTIDSEYYGVSFLQVQMVITKFEYTSVVEVDPVDVWAIIGAIGGVWQFVVMAFGVFFIFSEKQPPDKKMRNFHDTVMTPATTINRRLSSITLPKSSRSSQQDIEIDATDEDLPSGWVKRQRQDGGVYYYHVMTGATRVTAPNERDEISESTSATAAPQPRNGVGRLFPVAHNPQRSEFGGSHHASQRTNNGESLPPGWTQREDGNGKIYFVDTVNKKTQWNRPAWRSPSTTSSSVRAVDPPMRRSSQASRIAPSRISAPSDAIPSTTSGVTREIVDESLPPCWETRTTPDGKTYYANTVTEKTQWAIPV
eukprot:jgi/Undpi1/7280/HiC_scaffold_22.g09753.m1